MACLFRGNVAGGIAHCEHAATLSPADAGVASTHARALMMGGRLPEAREAAARAVQLLEGAPAPDHGHRVQAEIALAEGDLDLALAAASRSIAVVDGWPCRCIVAIGHARAGRDLEASAAIQKARELEPALTLRMATRMFEACEPGAPERNRAFLERLGLRD